jgi:hypothetical protein
VESVFGNNSYIFYYQNFDIVGNMLNNLQTEELTKLPFLCNSNLGVPVRPQTHRNVGKEEAEHETQEWIAIFLCFIALEKSITTYSSTIPHILSS